MPDLFVPLDVNYGENDRILRVSPLAELLFIRCLCLSKRTLSDGAVTFRQMQRLVDDIYETYPEYSDLPPELEAAGLLDKTDDGWRISSWEKHNKTRAEVKTMGTKLNHERWHVKRGKVDEKCAWCTESAAESGTESAQNPIDRVSGTDSVSGSVVLPGSGRIEHFRASDDDLAWMATMQKGTTP